MLLKIAALLAFIALPFSASFWYRSHNAASQHRYDLTLYKSVWVYLKDGLCGFEVLSMPRKVASRGEFHSSLGYDPLAKRGSLELHSFKHGPYHTTWIVFPLWVPNAGFVLACLIPIINGPTRRWWRHHKGCCTECGYNLTGNRSHRCPECGSHF